MPAPLSDDEINAALEVLADWQLREGALTRTVSTPAGAPALLRSVQQIAQEMDHHPDSDVQGEQVTFRLHTRDAAGITERDVELAARIDQVLSGSQATGTDPGRR